MLRAWWFTTLVSLVGLSGCMTEMSPVLDAGQCVDDRDCPDPKYFFCNTQTSQCEPACVTSVECNMRPAEFALELCAGPLGCWCDQGTCIAAMCVEDSDCGALACRNGACVEPPPETAVARCAVIPDLVIAAADQPLHFAVSMWDSSGEPIVISEGATWTAISPAVSGTAPRGNAATFTARAPATANAVAAVRATVGTVQCDARVLVLPEPSSDSAAIISVVDEHTGRGVEAAQVVVSSPDGGVVGQHVTNAAGWVEAANVPGNAVSVFHADFSYQTIVAVPDAARVVRVALQRNPLDRLGGYSVTYDAPPTSNLHLARVGLSSATDFASFTLTDDFEPTVLTHIVVGSAVDDMSQVPLGTFMGFGEQRLKNFGAAFGVNGVCGGSRGMIDDAEVLAGTCGAQTVWSLTSDTPLGDVPLDLGGNGFQLSFLDFLSRTSFKPFRSVVIRDGEFPLRLPPASGVGDLSDRSNFVSVNPQFGQLPLALQGSVRTPQVPKFFGVFAERMLLSPVVIQPGRGLIPLGVGYSGTTTPIDVEQRVAFRGAPRHHGLEASPFAFVLQALSNPYLRDPAVGRSSSSVLARVLPASLRHESMGAVPVDVRTQAFPLAVGATKWNPMPVVNRSLAPRSFSAMPASDVTVVRVVIRDALGARWDVLVDPAAPQFTLPAVPGALRDRLFDVGLANGKPSTMELQSMRFNAPAFTDRQVAFAEWVSAPELRDSEQHLTAWTRSEVRKKVITILSPREGGELASDRNVVLGLEGTAFGTGGAKALVRVKGGTGCGEFTVDSAAGQVPSSCRGSAVTIEAELLDENGEPYLPSIQASVGNVRIP
jgi:hypothetical protein